MESRKLSLRLWEAARRGRGDDNIPIDMLISTTDQTRCRAALSGWNRAEAEVGF